MKNVMRIFAVMIVGLCFAASAQAQGIEIGAKGGLNVSNVGGDDVSNNNALIRMHLGGYVDIAITDKFSFQPELVYSQQGANFEVGPLETDLEVHYINIPVMAKYSVVEMFYLEAGPQLGILVDDNFGGGDDLESTDFGLGFGLGVELPIKVGFNARYNLGLTDVTPNSNIQNRVFQIGVTYSFVSLGN